MRDESDECFVMLNLDGWRNRRHALEAALPRNAAALEAALPRNIGGADFSRPFPRASHR